MDAHHKTISLGGGCFWCIEAVYERVAGVYNVRSGYQGGHVQNPSYQEVCSGTSGHAEVVQLTYDPEILSTDDILAVFWEAHDPTQLNRQGADVGTQYRSIIFYYDEEQRESISQSLQKLRESGKFSKPIVTEVQKAPVFYAAESHHQDYYENNKSAPYCRFVISPKLKKLDMKP